MASVIGIDFGEAYSCVAIVKYDQGEVVADSQGERHIPGFVGFYPDSDYLVGHEAERRLGRYWQNTVFDVKSLLGTAFDDALNRKARWGFKIVPAKKGVLFVEVETQGGNVERLSPEQIASKILTKLKETAEEALHQKVTSACIGIPVNMSPLALEALSEAAKLAGFNDISFIPDPIACIMAYQLDQHDTTGLLKQIVVVDFGATLNVSLVTVQGGLMRIVETQKAPLTAASIEKELMNHFGYEFKRKTGLDYTESRKAVFKLQSECERVKKDLSQMAQTNIQLDGFCEGCDLTSNITRARFEAISENLFKGLLPPIQTIVNTAGGVDKISCVILSGGSTKIPRVQQLLKTFFGNVQILSSIDPSDVIARGAALQGSLISNRNPMLKQKRVGAKITGTSLSIGVARHDGSFCVIIPANTPLPSKVVKNFTVAEKQTKLLFSIYEGEDPVAKDNHLLGEYAYRCLGGKPVQASFLLDANANMKLVLSQGNDKEVFKLETTGGYKRFTLEDVQKLKNPPIK